MRTHLQLGHLGQAQPCGARPGAGLHGLPEVLVLRIVDDTLALTLGWVDPVGACIAQHVCSA